MSEYPYPIIAREGWLHVGIVLGLALAVTALAGWGWSAPFWLALVFVLQFFRDPARDIPDASGVVLSAADGKVVVVQAAEDPYLGRQALKISVFMNVFNVHANRSPVQGEVREAWRHAGKFLNAVLPKASLENERSAMWLRTPGGADVTAVQIAGLLARRILCYARPGDRLERGQRYGFIRFGSRVDLYLPPASRARVAVGDKVYAGETVLAELPGAELSV
ncbi:MAG TPA: phosphatidylserine decarboxylase [Burkholderiales bacterium]|nr:phosphatidylserine decarboxylase [Burkholderiales bacterium]